MAGSGYLTGLSGQRSADDPDDGVAEVTWAEAVAVLNVCCDMDFFPCVRMESTEQGPSPLRSQKEVLHLQGSDFDTFDGVHSSFLGGLPPDRCWIRCR